MKYRDITKKEAMDLLRVLVDESGIWPTGDGWYSGDEQQFSMRLTERQIEILNHIWVE